MKSFFKIFFASLLAFIVFNLVLFFILIGIASSGEEITVKQNSFLKIDLNNPIVEQTADDPFAELSRALGGGPVPISLIKILEAIENAKTDDNIKGIYLKADFPVSGYGQLEEVRQALQDFKSSGKPVIAYAENYSEMGYYMASVATKTYLNPAGTFEFNGLSSEVTFFKGTFEKLNINPQIFRVGTFKSAVEPFMRKDMSEASKKQMNVLLNNVYSYMLDNIAASLGEKNNDLSAAQLRAISNSLEIRMPQDAAKEGLVSGLKYYDEVLAELKDIAEVESIKDFHYISVNKYTKTFVANSYSKDRIAVIVAEGNIVSGKGGEGSIGSDTYAKQIRKARLDDKIKAIVIRINSPGGSALASDVMWREIMLAKEVKPVIASMSSVAASGGYYMAMGCDTIVAQPNTITGSIGIFSIIPDLSDFMDTKLGITFDRVSTGEYSDIITVTRPLNENEQQIIQNMVENGYEDFTTKAAQGRNMPVEELLKVASGRVWSGVEAKDKGLVDILGSYQDAIAIAAEKAGLEEGNYMKVYMPEKKPLIEQILQDLGGSAKIYLQELKYGEMAPYADELKYIMENKGLQARMPYDLEIQ